VIRVKIKAAGFFGRFVPVRLHGVTLWMFITVRAMASRTPNLTELWVCQVVSWIGMVSSSLRATGCRP